MTCHLYVVAHVIDGQLGKPVKIGISQNPKSRINSLRTGNPSPLEFAFVFDLPNKQIAKSMEDAFHSLQASCRLSGEWFNIEPIRAIKLMCIYLGAAIALNLGEDEHDRFADCCGLAAAEALVASVTGAI
jgi:hypothetical protein